MAISTTTLLCLLVFGFLMLFMGGNWWWMGIGLIILSTAAAVGGGEPARMPMTLPMPSMRSASKPAETKERPPPWARLQHGTDAQGNPLSTIDDLKFRPSVLADGAFGMCPMSETGPDDTAVGVGPRQGTLTIDAGPVRFKDDLRFRLSKMEGWDVCKTEEGKELIAWHFRTQKPVYQEKTRMLEPTMQQLDGEYWDWMNEQPWQKKDKKK